MLFDGTGTIVLAGDASEHSGMINASRATLKFDSGSRLGTNPSLALGNFVGFSTPSILSPTSSTTINKNIYLLALGGVQVDAGVTATLNGFITGTDANTAMRVEKFGEGNSF